MVEPIATILAGLLDLTIRLMVAIMRLLGASFRPWRYVLFPRFRAEMNAGFADEAARHRFLTRGALAMVGSVIVVGACVWLPLVIMRPAEKPVHEHLGQKLRQLLPHHPQSAAQP
ncbi:MAG TPA: hypothetical protein VM689_08815 [Aliidongia sp.]|nr:hypothetical protein [Aliidongia sp.]